VYIVEDILDYDSVTSAFRGMHTNCETLDLRNVKGRFDDALIILRF
jgi:hypothetical protein